MHSSFRLTAAMAAFLSATTTSAAAISTCASGASDVCFAVGVPSASASSNTGNLYLQLTAPTSYSWVALGVGSQEMAGANMFIMYADGAGNVTVSSRQGKGNVQPQYSASTASDLQLLEGSGVVNGSMVANLVCTNCKTWSGGSLSTTSTSSPWIAAWKEGSALDSTSPSENIAIHDGHSSFTIDLTQATIDTDSNPFTGAAASAPSSSGNTSSGNTSSSGVSQTAPMGQTVIWAHGLGMAIVFAIMYPLGSALMPLLGKWMFHAGWMVLTWLGMWAFFGLGVYGARQRDLLFNNSHTQFGTVIVCLLAIQPALGQLHHQYYLKHQSRGVVSYVHLWWGRGLILLGVVNGGVGLQLSRARNGYIVAYSVIAAFMYVVYGVVKGLRVIRNKKQAPAVLGGKMSPRTGYAENGDEVPMADYGARPHTQQFRGK